MACSALKRSYRDRLRAGRPELRMFFLVVGHEADEARLTTRRGHFFPEQLLDSQFATLELPEPSEAVTLIPTTGTPDQTADEILRDLGQAGSLGLADQPGGRPSSATTWSIAAGPRGGADRRRERGAGAPPGPVVVGDGRGHGQGHAEQVRLELIVQARACARHPSRGPRSR